jgi:hypothetical protein
MCFHSWVRQLRKPEWPVSRGENTLALAIAIGTGNSTKIYEQMQWQWQWHKTKLDYNYTNILWNKMGATRYNYSKGCQFSMSVNIQDLNDSLRHCICNTLRERREGQKSLIETNTLAVECKSFVNAMAERFMISCRGSPLMQLTCFHAGQQHLQNTRKRVRPMLYLYWFLTV